MPLKIAWLIDVDWLHLVTIGNYHELYYRGNQPECYVNNEILFDSSSPATIDSSTFVGEEAIRPPEREEVKMEEV